MAFAPTTSATIDPGERQCIEPDDLDWEGDTDEDGVILIHRINMSFNTWVDFIEYLENG